MAVSQEWRDERDERGLEQVVVSYGLLGMSNYHSQGAKGQYMYRYGQYTKSPLYYREIGKLDYTCLTPPLKLMVDQQH
jgi:hypothetical protein